LPPEPFPALFPPLWPNPVVSSHPSSFKMHKGRLPWGNGLYARCIFGSFPYAGITLIRSVKGRRKSGISVPQDTPNERRNYAIRIFFCQGNVGRKILTVARRGKTLLCHGGGVCVSSPNGVQGFMAPASLPDLPLCRAPVAHAAPSPRRAPARRHRSGDGGGLVLSCSSHLRRRGNRSSPGFSRGKTQNPPQNLHVLR